MPHSDATMTFAGTVTKLDVGGNGSNSAQLEFSVTPLRGQGNPKPSSSCSEPGHKFSVRWRRC